MPQFPYQQVRAKHAPKLPFLFRLVALVSVLSVLASCNNLPPDDNALADPGQLSSSQSQIGSSQVNIRPVVIPPNMGLSDLEAAEQELRLALREPLREILGEDADELFSQADIAYKVLNTNLVQELKIQSSRPPGLAQFEVLGLSFGIMLGLQSTAAESKHTPINVKDTLKLSENAGIEVSLTYTKSGSKLLGEVEMKVTTSIGESQLVETAKGRYEVDLCPDAQGHALVTFDLSMDTHGSGSGTSGGMQFSLKGSGIGLVNDDAAITDLDLDFSSALSQQGAGTGTGGQIKGEYAEVNTKISYTNMQDPANMSAGDPSVSVTRTSSAATRETVQSAYDLGMKVGTFFASLSLNQAEKLWQNGYCLELLVDGAGDINEVHPDKSKEFTATVRHKFEGADIDAPIVGTLSGEKSLSPLEKSISPVIYTYQAPPEKDKEAVAKLETRSNRGVAKKDLTFKVVSLGYTVSGMIEEFTFSGTICDPNKSFTVNAVASGGSAVLTFTPNAGGLEGTYTYAGGGAGFAMSGGGPYRILPGVNGYGTLEKGGGGCVNIGTCREGTDELSLSPLKDDSSCQ